ncbi:basic salivary proline-rich protein 3-like [Psammomys obesus]|uniref:basic salivary proline-rich protein 3-like n=1 Tax=Psammomys obesus TaxID=48139 RepID=UPI0024528814|nr:basic salivary proline-rich protein 3-like [Psammomys obesus]
MRKWTGSNKMQAEERNSGLTDRRFPQCARRRLRSGLQGRSTVPTHSPGPSQVPQTPVRVSRSLGPPGIRRASAGLRRRESAAAAGDSPAREPPTPRVSALGPPCPRPGPARQAWSPRPARGLRRSHVRRTRRVLIEGGAARRRGRPGRRPAWGGAGAADGPPFSEHKMAFERRLPAPTLPAAPPTLRSAARRGRRFLLGGPAPRPHCACVEPAWAKEGLRARGRAGAPESLFGAGGADVAQGATAQTADSPPRPPRPSSSTRERSARQGAGQTPRAPRPAPEASGPLPRPPARDPNSAAQRPRTRSPAASGRGSASPVPPPGYPRAHPLTSPLFSNPHEPLLS